MEVQVKEIEAKTLLTPQNVGSLSGHYDYTLNPYAGCAFRCSYCYVPKFPNGRHQAQDWGRWVEAKMNAPELIRKERLKVFGSRIFFSSAIRGILRREKLQQVVRGDSAPVQPGLLIAV